MNPHPQDRMPETSDANHLGQGGQSAPEPGQHWNTVLVLRRLVVTLCVWFIAFGACFATVAQVVEPSVTPAATADAQNAQVEDEVLPAAADTFTKIITARQALLAEVEFRNTELREAETEDQQAAIRAKIQELMARIQVLEQDFESIATGVDLAAFSTALPESFDWQAELHELLSPMLDELKKLTARPRELERLRNQALANQRRIDLTEDAIRNLQRHLAAADTAAVEQELLHLLAAWQQRQNELRSRLAAAQQQLADKEQAKEPLLTSVSQAFREFFKSRGLNLILAFLAFLVVFFLMRYAQRLVYAKTNIGKPGQPRSFLLRLTGLVYYVLTILAAAVAAIFALYLSGDWVLLGLALIFLFGLAWTGKQTLPHVWEQAKLLLNMSTVREGERVLYDGLPWRVLALNMYTRLHNPELKGGLVRLPLAKLAGLQSRPFYKEEPWFPTREGDLVELSDGCIGVVKLQTPEQVIIDTRGGCYQTYPTQAFLQANPKNYSINTFGVFVTFGLDYAHQAEIVHAIPDTLRAFLISALQREDYGAEMLDLVVQFKGASASSLDVLILAKFPGALADRYFAISRRLQGMLVEACNAYGWGIPFLQVTLHQAEPAPQSHKNS